jgi:hypothetical protein
VLVHWKCTNFCFIVFIWLWEHFCEVRITSFGFSLFLEKRVENRTAVRNFTVPVFRRILMADIIYRHELESGFKIFLEG